MYLLHFTIFVLLWQVPLISTSDGDRSPFYKKCVNNCITENCSSDEKIFKTSSIDKLSIWVRLLWNCKDNCRYDCMWRTVDIFQERGYHVPKFHGKWPFKRIFGVQEPASAFASLLNLATTLYMYMKIRRKFSVKNTPFALFWHCFIAVCLNAWLWSIIFHTRDTPFTEFMDYACAFSMVMALYVAAVVRIFRHKRTLKTILLVGPLLYYAEHVRYLYGDSVDYDYNMRVNLFFGVVGSLMWVSWSGAATAAGRRHAWRAAAWAAAAGAALTLELLEFPPRRHVWDAHALWHLATAPLPLLFYRFVIDDLHYLQAPKGSEKLDLKLA